MSSRINSINHIGSFLFTQLLGTPPRWPNGAEGGGGVPLAGECWGMIEHACDIWDGHSLKQTPNEINEIQLI